MTQSAVNQADGVAPVRGYWVTAARVAWLALTAVVLIATALQVPLVFHQVHTTCVPPHCTGAQLSRVQAHALQSIGVSLDAYAFYSAAWGVVFAFIYVAVAAAIMWRRSGDRMGIFTAFTLVIFGGITFNGSDVLNGTLPPALQLVLQVLALLGDIGIALFFFLFPDGRVVLRWPALLLIPWVVLNTGYYLAPNSALDINRVPPLLSTLSWVLAIGVFIYVQIYRYRNVSDAAKRQQTKWVVYGSCTAGAGFLATISLYQVLGLDTNPFYLIVGGTIIYLFILLIPLSITVAILRYRLWDVDLLINRTLVYGLVTALLAILYIGSVILLQALFRAITGQGSGLAVAISTLTIAALFQPLRRSMQSLIDRRFYRRKYDAAQMLITFQAKLRDEVDLDQLTADLLGVIQDTVQPAHVSIWLRDGEMSEASQTIDSISIR
jgi:hypothetical protein